MKHVCSNCCHKRAGYYEECLTDIEDNNTCDNYYNPNCDGCAFGIAKKMDKRLQALCDECNDYGFNITVKEWRDYVSKKLES